MTIDSEKAWLNFFKKNLRDLFPKFCDRAWLNRTRRNLQTVIEKLTKQISFKLGYCQCSYRIVGSILIPVCKFGRAVFHKTFRGSTSYGRSPP
jgi:hypothetical protein